MNISCPLIEKEYDLAFSLGGACSCTQTLRKAGLQYHSFPFDWVRGATIDERAKMLVEGMADFLVKDDLRYVDKNVNGLKDIYRSEKTGVAFYHDFPICSKVDEVFPMVEEKYRRRYLRLVEHLEKASRVLVAYLTSPEDEAPNAEELIKTLSHLKGRFPSAQFDLVAFRNSSDGKAEVKSIQDNIVEITMPFQSTKAGAPVWLVDFDLLVNVFSATTVVDYRTDEERARFGSISMKAEDRSKALYEYLHCTGKVDYFWAKINWRLYRHFKKFFTKRGVELW